MRLKLESEDRELRPEHLEPPSKEDPFDPGAERGHKDFVPMGGESTLSYQLLTLASNSNLAYSTLILLVCVPGNRSSSDKKMHSAIKES